MGWKNLGWNDHTMNSYLLYMNFFTIGIQALQNRWKSIFNTRETMLKNKLFNRPLYSAFGHIPLDYLVQSINFSDNTYIPHLVTSMRVFWSALKLFIRRLYTSLGNIPSEYLGQPINFSTDAYIPHLVTFHQSILVSLLTFQPTPIYIIR